MVILLRPSLIKIISITTLLLNVPFVKADVDLDFPNYVGPQPCPSNPSLLGYTNTTTLHYDMLNQAKQAAESKMLKDNYTYILCPNTIFDFGSNYTKDENQTIPPITPILSNTIVQCGHDGELEHDCVLSGGLRQIHMYDFFILQNVVFRGITMTKNEGVNIGASGNPFSNVTFVQCLLQENKGHSLLQIYFDGNVENYNRHLIEDNSSPNGSYSFSEIQREPFQLPFDKSVYYDINFAVAQQHHLSNNNIHETNRALIRHTHQTQERQLVGYRGMSVTILSSDIFDNVERVAGIANIGGILTLMNCDISFNEIGLTTVAIVFGAHLSMSMNTYFRNNVDVRGPVFIDKHSTLKLNKDVHGENNQGSKCDVFLERPNSFCEYENGICVGDCCDFGNESCDETEDEVDVPPSVLPTNQTKTIPGVKTQNVVGGGRRCGSLCISLSVIVPVVVLGLFILAIIIGWRYYRSRAVPEIDSLEVEPRANIKAVHA